MENTIKNILLAGIGTLAYTYEKAAGMIDDLVKKGELTVMQGKQLNEELKRKFDKPQTGEQTTTVLTPEMLKEVLSELNLATKRDLDELKERISALENR